MAFPLFGFQKRFIQDKARQKGWLKSRQIGGSMTVSLDAVLDAMKTGQDWNFMSRTGRQAARLLEKAAKHVKAYNEYATKVLATGPVYDPREVTTDRIKLANGATITAMPCDPDTTVGDACNWVLDEFALFPKSHAVFGVIKPAIRWGKRIIVLSTPRGRKNKFYELWLEWEQHGPACGWSWHQTTIQDAVADGCPLYDHEGRALTFEEFKRQEVRDVGEELWPQEYECAFLDASIVFLPYNLITACMHECLPLVRTPASLRRLERDLCVGVDVGRKHDLTVIWVISIDPGGFTTQSVHALDRVPFVQQEQAVSEILATGRVTKCCIDQQGIGAQLAENLCDRFPGVVEGVNFTNAAKDAMASRLKVHMQAGEFALPADDAIRDDFYSVEKSFTDAGRPILTAPRNKGGHADRFWAAALALHAAAAYVPFSVVMAS